MKKIFKEAHKMTREMVEKYGVDYQVQFGLCLAYLLEEKEQEKEMVELQGSEKQIAWATKLRDGALGLFEELDSYKYQINKNDSRYEKGMTEAERYEKFKNIVLNCTSASKIIATFREWSSDENYILNPKLRKIAQKNGFENFHILLSKQARKVWHQ